MLALLDVENKVKDLTETLHDLAVKYTTHRELWPEEYREYTPHLELLNLLVFCFFYENERHLFLEITRQTIGTATLDRLLNVASNKIPRYLSARVLEQGTGKRYQLNKKIPLFEEHELFNPCQG